MPSITSNTPYGIIADAMFDAGLLEEGQQPNSEQLTSNFRRLNDMINLWQTQGLKLFLLQEISIDLIASQNTYTVNPTPGTVPSKHMRIIQGRVQQIPGDNRPIYPISWEEWNRLPQLQEGSVTGYFVDKQPTSLIVKFWNTPDVQEAINTVVLLVQTQVINPINLEQSMQFPQEWRLALRWGLASEISTGQPQAIMDRCDQRAEVYRSALEDWDVEDAPTMFAPDFRGAYPTRSFR